MGDEVPVPAGLSADRLAVWDLVTGPNVDPELVARVRATRLAAEAARPRVVHASADLVDAVRGRPTQCERLAPGPESNDRDLVTCATCLAELRSQPVGDGSGRWVHPPVAWDPGEDGAHPLSERAVP